MTDKIISEYIDKYGFCPFGLIADRLIDCRGKGRLPENPKTVICCLFPYFLGKDKYEGADISKYAVVPDYHNVVTDILSEICQKLKKEYPEEEFVPFTDNSPVPEVQASLLAGLGVRGKNGLLINEDYGSYVFIGEIVTTKDYGSTGKEIRDCLNCGLCEKCCPAASIADKSNCFSHLNQQKQELSENTKKLIRETGCAWGCDICQDVCPLNRNIKINPLPPFLQGVRAKADPENLTDRAYGWRGKKVIERNLEILYKKEG